MLDLDDFKRINDRLRPPGRRPGPAGHRRRLAASVRTSDVVARYGGDEFVVLMPETDGARPAHVAERAARPSQRTAHPMSDGIGSTSRAARAGRSTRRDGDGARALLRSADAAMYTRGGADLGRRAGRDGHEPPMAGGPGRRTDTASGGCRARRTLSRLLTKCATIAPSDARSEADAYRHPREGHPPAHAAVERAPRAGYGVRVGAARRPTSPTPPTSPDDRLRSRRGPRRGVSPGRSASARRPATRRHLLEVPADAATWSAWTSTVTTSSGPSRTCRGDSGHAGRDSPTAMAVPLDDLASLVAESSSASVGRWRVGVGMSGLVDLSTGTVHWAGDGSARSCCSPRRVELTGLPVVVVDNYRLPPWRSQPSVVTIPRPP